MDRSNVLKPFSLLLLILFVTDCARVPIVGRKQFTPLPSGQMVALGKNSYQEVMKNSKISDDRDQAAMVKEVGQNIVAAVENYLSNNGLSDRTEGFLWEYRLLAEDVVNAWAMPGGKIAFYEGIMPICENKNGLAVVMGHEIAHAIARHANERMAQQLGVQLGGMALSVALAEKPETTQELALAAFGYGTQLGLILPFSRKHESEADELGLYFMAMGGYDPREAPDFWRRMAEAGGSQPPEFLSTHPSHETRIDHLNEVIPKVMKFYDEASQTENRVILGN